MVKKLFKHEFHAYGRVMSIIYIILLTVAVATRVIMSFESDTTAYEIVSSLTLVTYCVSIFAAIGFSFVMAIIRFYKNLFTSEGYLTFTLPVTSGQHIMVKAVTAVCVDFITVLVVLISALIVIPGEILTEIWNSLGKTISLLYEVAGIHSVFFGVELFIIILAASFSGIMLYYTFISIGQLFKKNRILAAVGAYFVYYIISQIASTILTISFSVFAESYLLADMMFWISEHPYESIHIFMCGGIILSTIFVLIEYFVIHFIISKKLNLE